MSEREEFEFPNFDFGRRPLFVSIFHRTARARAVCSTRRRPIPSFLPSFLPTSLLPREKSALRHRSFVVRTSSSVSGSSGICRARAHADIIKRTLKTSHCDVGGPVHSVERYRESRVRPRDSRNPKVAAPTDKKRSYAPC